MPLVQFAGLGRGLPSADKAGTGITPAPALALDDGELPEPAMRLRLLRPGGSDRLPVLSRRARTSSAPGVWGEA